LTVRQIAAKMLRMDSQAAEEVGVAQLFDTPIKRAAAVLQAWLDYYRVKKVPPIAAVERIEIEDAALAVVTGEFCLTDVVLRLDTLRYEFNAEGGLMTDDDGFPAE